MPPGRPLYPSPSKEFEKADIRGGQRAALAPPIAPPLNDLAIPLQDAAARIACYDGHWYGWEPLWQVLDCIQPGQYDKRL